jgi:hypothetical protein
MVAEFFPLWPTEPYPIGWRVARLYSDGTLEGAHDPRADGGAAGV